MSHVGSLEPGGTHGLIQDHCGKDTAQACDVFVVFPGEAAVLGESFCQTLYALQV